MSAATIQVATVAICLLLCGCSKIQPKLPEVETGNALVAYQLIAAINRGESLKIDALLTGDALKSKGSISQELNPDGCNLGSVSNTKSAKPLAGLDLNVMAIWNCPSREGDFVVELAVTERGWVSGVWRGIME